MLTTLECRARYLVMRRRRHDDRRRVNSVEQLLEAIVRRDAKLVGHGRGPISARLVETNQARTCHVAQNADVMVAEGAGSDHPDAHIVLLRHGPQITSPRSLRSRKLRNSSTSG